MKQLETIIININGEHLRLEAHKENLPCEKLKKYITFCSFYGYPDCKNTCNYSEKMKKEESNDI